MNIGLISFAHFHAWTYGDYLAKMDGIRIAAVADENSERGQRAAQRYQCKYFPDYRDLLRQTGIDAVVICSENARHAEMVIEAAYSGKSILCEKPMATTIDDAQRMLDACQQNKVIFQVALANRYLGPVREMEWLVRSGVIGQLKAVHSTNRGKNPGEWFLNPDLSGGGAVVDHTVHALDILRWILKSEVVEVYAELGHRFGKCAVEDAGLLMFEFDNGVFVSHDPSWSYVESRPEWGDLTFELIGDLGTLRVDGFSEHVTIYDERERTIVKSSVGYPKEVLMLQDFVDCVRLMRPSRTSGYDGLKAIEVTLAAYESAKLGRPVRIQELYAEPNRIENGGI